MRIERENRGLPIDEIRGEIGGLVRRGGNFVVEAPPGAGKTTRVPSFLSDDLPGGIVVLEPRRLAARLAARRVADERGERVGETVGYQVRFEDVTGPKTRLRFVTEGVLLRRMLGDPTLAGVQAVVLDEFHERHIQTDVALALLVRLQQTTRPDLNIIAMSATLDAAPVAAFLGDCPVLRSEGKLHEVAVEHLDGTDDRPLETRVAGAVRKAVGGQADSGDLLVFLPGAAEIRRVRDVLADFAGRNDLLVLPLHGDLSPEEQDRAVGPSSRRKVILSTNVAESSVTIDGVTTVIDSGLARVPKTSPWSGLSSLDIARVSRASAVQRAGRAGRTRPGRCLRLYTKHDFETRPEFEIPEIKRLDLAEILLSLHGLGIADPTALAWFDPPSVEGARAADELLRRLGAVDAEGGLTDVGRRMLDFPVHPRLSRLVIEAERQGFGAGGCLWAALLSERDVRFSSRSRLQTGGGGKEAALDAPSDLLVQNDLFAEAERVRFAPERLKSLGLDPGTVSRVERTRRQLVSSLREKKGGPRAGNPQKSDEALLKAVLAGFPDRVARRRPKTTKGPSDEVLLSGGGAARVSDASAVRRAEFLVAVQAEDRAAGQVLIRTASGIEPEWLLELFPDSITERGEIRWDAGSKRVEAVEQMLYDRLVIDESRTTGGDEDQVAHVLAEAARAVGIRQFIDGEKFDRLAARVGFLSRTFPELGFPELSESLLDRVLIEVCRGCRSFADLKAATGHEFSGVEAASGRLFTKEQAAALDRSAPEFTSLPRRRRVPVNYEPDRPPWIASRLQDFFGLKQGPTVAGGKVPVVLHLLAPNGRPVQVTTDLAGFWERTYPQVRKELSRRYPRHAWPENPLTIEK